MGMLSNNPSGVHRKPGTSKTKKSFKAMCDINTIMKGFDGRLPAGAISGRDLDCTKVGDFHEVMNRSVEAEARIGNLFMRLPVNLRKRFRGEVEEFINFANDPGNKEELDEMLGKVMIKRENRSDKESKPGVDDTKDIVVDRTEESEVKGDKDVKGDK